ncbi:MAG: hypothetical protein ACXACR_02505 [Candidatus Hodarchaeales archaeon]|jgi:hypothetical protein
MSEQELTFKEMKDIKDIYLAKKQGEALERITHPKKHYEGLGLGFYGPSTVLALASVDLIEDTINALALGKPEKKDEVIELVPAFEKTFNSLKIFTETIGVASGSRDFKRAGIALETIGLLGQYIPFQKHQRQDPEKVDLND